MGFIYLHTSDKHFANYNYTHKKKNLNFVSFLVLCSSTFILSASVSFSLWDFCCFICAASWNMQEISFVTFCVWCKFNRVHKSLWYFNMWLKPAYTNTTAFVFSSLSASLPLSLPVSPSVCLHVKRLHTPTHWLLLHERATHTLWPRPATEL